MAPAPGIVGPRAARCARPQVPGVDVQWRCSVQLHEIGRLRPVGHGALETGRLHDEHVAGQPVQHLFGGAAEEGLLQSVSARPRP